MGHAKTLGNRAVLMSIYCHSEAQRAEESRSKSNLRDPSDFVLRMTDYEAGKDDFSGI